MKYYYGNSYKEAISNPPIQITNTNILKAYEDNYNCVFPAEEDWDEEYYQLVYKYKNDNEEHIDEYDDYDDCEDNFNHMVDENDCQYIVMRQIDVYGNNEEIEIIDEYWDED